MINVSEALKKIEDCSMLIFDFDGVLANSVKVKTDAFSAMYADYGDEVRMKVIGHHCKNGGMSRYEKFKFYHLNFLGERLNNRDVEKLANQFSELVMDKVVESPEITGAGRFLQKYCVGNKVVVINTATPTDEIKQIIKRRGLSHYFTTIVGSPATKIDNLNYLMKLQNKLAEECLFFGDAKADLDAAKESGVDFIGIGESIKKIIKENNKTRFFISLTDRYAFLKTPENISYTYHFGNKNGYSYDMSGCFNVMTGALDMMLGAAKYLGFSKVVLLGCDYLGSPSMNSHFYSVDKPLVGKVMGDYTADYGNRIKKVADELKLDVLTIFPKGIKSPVFKSQSFSEYFGLDEQYHNQSQIIIQDYYDMLKLADLKRQIHMLNDW